MQDAPKLPTVGDIAHFMDRWAPPFLQESYDNAGLLVGEGGRRVRKVLVGLDCNEALIEEAETEGADMVVVHHPLIFKGIKRLVGQDGVQRTVERAIRSGIAVHAAHTNLDHVPNGVNAALAAQLGIPAETLRPLQPKGGLLCQLVVYVPTSEAPGVAQALFDAGAGTLGRYDQCGFEVDGIGGFRPLDGAQPALGQVGERTRVDETRLEVLVPRWRLSPVLAAMRAAHPYEEIAHQVITLENPHPHIGSGMVGELAVPQSMEGFLDQVKVALGCGVIRHSRLVRHQVKRVAICGGAGAFLTPDAIRQGADLYITSDLKYHDFEAAQGQLVLADVGHFESEWPVTHWIQEQLEKEFRDIFPNFAVRLAQNQTNPVHYR